MEHIERDNIKTYININIVLSFLHFKKHLTIFLYYRDYTRRRALVKLNYNKNAVGWF